MKIQQQSSQALSKENDHSYEQAEFDDEMTTLSISSTPELRKEKLQLYRAPKANKVCLCFNNRCQFLLFILIVVLVGASGYLIYDNRIQQGEITQILTILQQNQNKQKASAPSLHLETEIDELQIKLQKGTQPTSYEISKKLWYFNRQELMESRQWTQLAFKRIKKIAQESGFSVELLNEASWKKFLSKPAQKRLQKVTKELTDGHEQQGISQHQVDKIIRELTVLEVLRQNGGIFIEQDMVLTEGLQWVLNVTSNKLVNAWQLMHKDNKNAQVVGFFVPEASSEPQKYSRIDTKEQTEQYIVRFPSISPVFLAAAPQAPFIEDLLEEYYSAVGNFSGLPALLKRQHVDIEFVEGKEEWLLAISCQLALRKKQLQLQIDQLAIEYYHLAAININVGPNKLRSYLGETQADKIFNHLSLIPKEELEYQFGSIRFLAALAPIQKIQGIFQSALQNKSILKGSFLHQLLMGGKGDALVVAQQKMSEKQWNSLPAKLWLFLQEPAHSNSFFTQLWISHLKKCATEAKFQMLIVNDDNMQQYLSKETVDSIKQVLTANKLNIYESTKKQLVSLAILHEHGGVWVQPYVFCVQGLAWLRHIGKQRFIWNRFGELPKVVAAFHPHFGSPFHWNYDKDGHRQAWHLAYEHSLIAAEPKAELIIDWFNQLKANLQLDYRAVLHKFDGCKISDHRWISEQNQQLLSQDSIKCALGSKALHLLEKGDKKSAGEYYGIWGLNGFAGLLKIREYTNFMRVKSMDNPYIWRIPFQQMQSLVGNISFFTKIYEPTTKKIQKLYLENIAQPLKEFNSHSFLMDLVQKTNDKVVQHDGSLYLEEDYHEYEKAQKAKLQSEKTKQLLANIPKILWVLQGGEIDRNEAFTRLVLENNRKYASASSFQVRFVNDQNYKAWLNADSQTYKKLTSLLGSLSKKATSQQSNFKDHYQRIKGELILLTLLYENGGLYITKKLILHQDLSWLRKVQTLPYINHANKASPKVFGFFSPGYSSQQNNDGHVESPSLQNFFLASGKKTQFVKDFLQEYTSILEERHKVKEHLSAVGYNLNWLHGDDPYYETFFLATQFTLQKKKKQLSDKGINQSPLESYGLYALNTYYYPYRLHRYFSAFKSPVNSVIKSLGGTHLTELEAQVGSLNYFSVIYKQQEVGAYAEAVIKGENEAVEQSFLHKYLLPVTAKGVVKHQIKYQSTPTNKKWTNLPKTVWVCIPQGVKSSPLGVQIFFAALRQAGTEAGFEVKQVNDKTIEQFIDKFNLKKISKLITKNNQQYKSLLYRLAILAQNGGIALAPETLLTQGLSWVQNIADFNRMSIFNRFGDTPKVLMTVDTLRSPASKWVYDFSKQTKIGHNIGWSDVFIAAERDNELVKEWYEEFTTYLQLDAKQLEEVFEECKMRDLKWSSTDSSRLGSDALLCVLNRKEGKLVRMGSKAHVCEEYKLWGIGESFGANKLGQGLNLDEIIAQLNPFLWKRPITQVQAMIGEIKPFIKLNKQQLNKVEHIVTKKKAEPWGEKETYLTKFVYDRVKKNIKIVNDKPTVDL